MDTLTRLPALAPPKTATRHGACGRWWTGAERSHCGGCHQTFTGMSAFERHRKGLRCNDPASVGLVARFRPYGVLWGWPAPDGGMGGVHED